MDKNKKALYDLMQNYLYDCERNGYSDFGVWCEDNLENKEQELLLFEIVNHVNAITEVLF